MKELYHFEIFQTEDIRHIRKRNLKYFLNNEENKKAMQHYIFNLQQK